MSKSVRIDCPVCNYEQVPEHICPNCDTDISLLRSLLELPILETANERNIESVINAVPQESNKSHFPKIWFLLLLGIAIGFAMGSWTGYSMFQSAIISRIPEKIAQPISTQIAIAPNISTPSSPKTSPPKSYEIQTGDSLEAIALRFCGSDATWRDFVIANPILIGREDSLEVGEKLTVPKSCIRS